MITPDGLHIASRAQYDSVESFPRTAVIVDVNPGDPAFSAPTFANTLLDPGLGIRSTAASNISDDGTIAYGFGSAGNFVWTAESGLVLLPPIDLGVRSTVGGSNASDGSKVLIFDFSCDDTFAVCHETSYVYDKMTNSYTALLPLEGDDSVQAFAMSSNGKVAAGMSYTSTLDDNVFFVEGELVTWDLKTGKAKALGSPNMDWYTSDFGGITEDGKAIVVEFNELGTGTRTLHPYLYNRNGFFELEDVLSDAGVDLSGWEFTFDVIACANCGIGGVGGSGVFGVSPDGDLIFGGALHKVGGEWVPEGFIVSGLPNNYLKNYKPR